MPTRRLHRTSPRFRPPHATLAVRLRQHAVPTVQRPRTAPTNADDVAAKQATQLAADARALGHFDPPGPMQTQPESRQRCHRRRRRPAPTSAPSSTPTHSPSGWPTTAMPSHRSPVHSQRRAMPRTTVPSSVPTASSGRSRTPTHTPAPTIVNSTSLSRLEVAPRPCAPCTNLCHEAFNMDRASTPYERSAWPSSTKCERRTPRTTSRTSSRPSATTLRPTSRRHVGHAPHEKRIKRTDDGLSGAAPPGQPRGVRRRRCRWSRFMDNVNDAARDVASADRTKSIAVFIGQRDPRDGL